MAEPVRDDDLGAFCRHVSVRVQGAATGPLAGLDFAAKDIFDIAGEVTGCGNPDWLRTHGPAESTAPAVQRLLDAGASMVGKTITDELAFSLNGENVHYGTPRNSRAPDRIPGGSSAGSAAAVAGDAVPVALGSDTGGSVRVPASFCGIFGMRPTHGRIPLDGIMPLAPSFDTVGWFARDAALLRRVGHVLLGDDAAPKPGRLLLAQDGFALALADVRDALLSAVARSGLDPTPVRVCPSDLADWHQVFRVLQGGEIWAVHGPWIQSVRPRFGPLVHQRFEMVARITPNEIAAAAARREAITEYLHGLLEDNAVLVLPTAPDIAPLKGSTRETLEGFRARALSLTCIAGLARLPQISIPVAFVRGAPVGLSLIGSPGADGTLLALAAEFADRIPG